MAICMGIGFMGGCGTSAQEKRVQHLDNQLRILQGHVSRYDTRLRDVANRMLVLSDAVDSLRIERAGYNGPPKSLTVVRLAPKPQASNANANDTSHVTPFIQTPLVQEHKVKATKATFRHALDAFRAGRTDEAYDYFSAFAQRNPGHESVGNAIYWMGECRFDDGRFAAAIEEYEKVLQHFPLSNKVPDALLRLGVASGRLGWHRKARAYYKRLVDHDPTSALAELARTRLAERRKGATP